jgi:hypothetical protein
MGIPSLNQFQANQTAVAADVNENFETLKSYVDTNCILKDASLDFTSVPAGPAADPVDANDLTRKQYVDNMVKAQTGFGMQRLTTTAQITDANFTASAYQVFSEASWVIGTAGTVDVVLWATMTVSNNNAATTGDWVLEYTTDATAVTPTYTSIYTVTTNQSSASTGYTYSPNLNTAFSGFPFSFTAAVAAGKTLKVRSKVRENLTLANKWNITDNLLVIAGREVSFA